MYLTQKTRSCLRKERNYKRTGPLALRCRTMYAPFRPKIDHHMKMSDLFARLWKDGNKAAPDFQLGFVVFNRFLFFLSFFECMLHAFRILVFRKTAGNFLLSEIPYFCAIWFHFFSFTLNVDQNWELLHFQAHRRTNARHVPL